MKRAAAGWSNAAPSGVLAAIRRKDAAIVLPHCEYIAHRIARHYFIAGADRDDVLQIARIGICEALRDFHCLQPRAFFAFADLVALRRVQTAARLGNAQKHRALTASARLELPVGEDGGTLADVIPLHGPGPADIAEQREQITELFDALDGLTQMEHDVFVAQVLEGRSYDDIATRCGLDGPKAVDNALWRIRRKLVHVRRAA